MTATSGSTTARERPATRSLRSRQRHRHLRPGLHDHRHRLDRYRRWILRDVHPREPLEYVGRFRPDERQPWSDPTRRHRQLECRRRLQVDDPTDTTASSTCPATPAAGKGLHNSIAVAPNSDLHYGGDQSSSANAACINPPTRQPVINVAKTAGAYSGPDANGVYTVTYKVTVTNTGAAPGTYTSHRPAELLQQLADSRRDRPFGRPQRRPRRAHDLHSRDRPVHPDVGDHTHRGRQDAYLQRHGVLQVQGHQHPERLQRHDPRVRAVQPGQHGGRHHGPSSRPTTPPVSRRRPRPPPASAWTRSPGRSTTSPPRPATAPGTPSSPTSTATG